MKVELLKDFGGKSKGVGLVLPASLSASLIRKGIAKVYTDKKVKEPKTEK